MQNIFCPNIFIGGCKITLWCNVLQVMVIWSGKKNVFDKVMLLARLKEEEFIVVREVKQHMEYMKSVAGQIEEFTFQLTEDTNGKCKNNTL